MIGQLTVQAAQGGRIRRVFAVDIDDAKLALARKLGADETFNSEDLRCAGGDRGADRRTRRRRGP